MPSKKAPDFVVLEDSERKGMVHTKVREAEINLYDAKLALIVAQADAEALPEDATLKNVVDTAQGKVDAAQLRVDALHVELESFPDAVEVPKGVMGPGFVQTLPGLPIATPEPPPFVPGNIETSDHPLDVAHQETGIAPPIHPI